MSNAEKYLGIVERISYFWKRICNRPKFIFLQGDIVQRYLFFYFRQLLNCLWQI